MKFTSKTDKRNRTSLKADNQCVALIQPGKYKIVVYTSTRLGTKLDTFKSKFANKNTKKTIKADAVVINPAYTTSGGKNSYYAKIDFPADADVKEITQAFKDLAEKSDTYKTEQKPAKKDADKKNASKKPETKPNVTISPEVQAKMNASKVPVLASK